MDNILKILKKIGIKKFQLHGDFIAKVNCEDDAVTKGESSANYGKLVLVTAMTSNKSGVGKTTISIGLADALNELGSVCVNTSRNSRNAKSYRAMLALREPSMGPVFGIKGGATGGGKSSLFPSDEINLHFTGDFHAIAQANNLLSSIIDNHIFQGNALEIDTQRIFFKRCLDLNDRSLREITYKIGDCEVTTGFNITASSEVMAVLALSENLTDLKKNLGNILVALNKNGAPIFARDLHAEEAMTILLKDAFRPNLVQTLAGTPALVHLGPFANIAHGCNSVVATKFALNHADFCVTEAGFGSDLGAEKFLDIKCRILGKTPDVVVLVVTLSVVKEHGDGDVFVGFENVKKHIQNLRDRFGLSTVVAINKHADDDEKELFKLKTLCEEEGVEAVVCRPFEKGGKGCVELAKSVVDLSTEKSDFKFCYYLNESVETKIEKIAKNIYGARSVTYSKEAEEKIALAKRLKFDDFFVNVAKTQFSFSGDKNLLGAPKNFDLHVSDVEIRAGAKMIVPIVGNMLLMPGLGKYSNYENMSIDGDGNLRGMF